MDLDLRQAVLANLKNKSEELLQGMVETAIKDNEEKTLPGLGVVFEVIWQHTNTETQEAMIEALSKNI